MLKLPRLTPPSHLPEPSRSGAFLRRAAAARRAFILPLLAALALGFMLAFMFYGARGDWSFILPFRGGKLLALILVAYAVAVSTVLFQTVTHNRILTPSLMGFDQLYTLIQTLIVFAAGGLHFSALNSSIGGFFISAALLTVFAAALFQGLFVRLGKNLHLVLLTGIIFGVFFRSVSNFLSRMIDPNEFAVLANHSFANFNSYNSSLLAIAAVLIGLVSLFIWPMRAQFDILALGREAAVNLGVSYQRATAKILLMIAVLIAVATALVGPVTFFGLLVANLAYQLSPSARHARVLPAAVLIAIITLVGGQFILERLFHFNTALSIIIDFLGGIIFILLLLKGKIR